jgi:hypothetical protein
MQKYLWGAAALVVVGTAAAFVAVEYAMKYPGSVLTTTAAVAASAGTHVNPFSDSGTVSTPDAAAPADIEESVEPILIEPAPPATHEPPMGDAETSEIPWEYPLVEPMPIEPMPYADDDAAGACDTSAMPVSLFKKFLKAWQAQSEGEEFGVEIGISGCLGDGTFGWCVPPTGGCDTHLGVSWLDAIRNAMWGCGGEECEMPTMPAWLERMIWFQFPLVSEIPLMPDVEEPAQEQPDENMPEQTEETMPEQTEVPDYHHYHHGCPYTGGCPYMSGYQVMPPQSAVEIPEAKPCKPWTLWKPPVKKHKPYMDLDLSGLKYLMRRLNEKQCFRPCIDTMEFRPSDAGRYPMVFNNPF